MVNIMLVDDHVIVRQGIRLLLEEEDDFLVVAEAESGDEAIPVALSHHPDVVLMDVHMPQGIDGITATRRLREELPDTKVIMLTMFDDEAHIEKMLQAGAAGVVLKNDSSSEIVAAIYRVTQRGANEPYLPTKMSDSLRERLLSRLQSPVDSSSPLLSPRETEVLTLIAKGYINKEIAERLHISVKTVETHRARIIERIGAQSKADLVSYAVNHGLN
ncbi:response regulator transcription factor [Alicyclobacillus sp. SO9]|uniref:response regulator n=1 Tax=Alicyclobacillus sp. SO9 TaxID=2665646 RepID=UPI0018E8E6E6|nr:response regulator transcription factor [Alicyclobacillus sp. SO9]QQE78281.1 response regulator transcription factor [Alicyclobacillus sp. SO9]